MTYIKRQLYQELEDHLSQKEITVIVGPRQAGKTTLMRMLEQKLQGQGAKTLYLNLDIERDKEYIRTQDILLSKIRLEFGANRGYIFIDEIQRKEDAGLFLKGLYDMDLSYKFIVSGSGSVELKGKLHESLAGRKRIFELTPLTFEEFIHFRTNYAYERVIADFFTVEPTKVRLLLEEYLSFGGYPRVVLEESAGEKQRIIDEIYQSYLERDIAYFLGVRKTADFTHLVRVLAAQIGNLVMPTELSRTLGLSIKTVQQYLSYLEKTYMLLRVTPYFRNARKEITKTPLFYFNDLGFRSYAAGEFGTLRDQSRGFVFENFVYQILREKVRFTSARVHFWRTKDGAEVDFVIALGDRLIAIEVKYQELKAPTPPRSLLNFITKYHPVEILVVNLKLKETVRTDEGVVIRFIPVSDLFLWHFFQ